MRKTTLILVIMVCLSSLSLFHSVKAEDYVSDNSPSFPPASTHIETLDNVLSGEILQWYWSSSDSLSFTITSPGGTIYTESSYGIMYAAESGVWTFRWRNNNPGSSAYVYYTLQSFPIIPEVVQPTPDTTIPVRNIQVSGTCYSDLDSFQYSYDNDSYHYVSHWSGNWAFDAQLNEGPNTLYLMFSYNYGDTYVGYKEIHFDVDTSAARPSITHPQLNTELHRRMVLVAGTTHPDMEYLYYSYDNFSYFPVVISDTNFSFFVNLTDGNNIIYLQYTYDYAPGYVGYGEVLLKVNKFWTNDDGFLGLGVGIWIVISLLIVLVILVMIISYLRQTTLCGNCGTLNKKTNEICYRCGTQVRKKF